MSASLLKRDLTWQRQINVKLYNSAVTELVHQPPDGWRVVRLNCVAHLPADELRSLA